MRRSLDFDKLVYILTITILLVTPSVGSPAETREKIISYQPFDNTTTTHTCTSDSECNHPHGLCVSGSCSCRLFYSGATCENSWKQNHQFDISYEIYTAWVIVTQLSCVVVASYQLYITFKHANVGNWKAMNITTYELIILLIAGIGMLHTITIHTAVRIISFAVDPRGYRGIVPPVADEFIFNLSLILWLCTAFMTFLYWYVSKELVLTVQRMELQTNSGFKELLSLSKYRPYLIGFLIFCMVIILPVSIWRAVDNNPISVPLYLSSLGLLMIVFIVMATTAGVNLIRIIKVGNSKMVFGSSAMQRFVDHLIIYIILLDSLLAIVVLTLALYFVLDAQRNMWIFITLNFLLRTEEFSLIASSLWFLRKKKPKTPEAISLETRRSSV